MCVFAVCHAELNAIMNKNSADVKGCTMYVALFPCNECAKLIIQAGESVSVDRAFVSGCLPVSTFQFLFLLAVRYSGTCNLQTN